ncbi:LacI family DNA-binding transcriptional regulator, partial [Cetobacterium sp.]
MTLEEISILTGSSITTISRVINDKPGVSKEKR